MNFIKESIGNEESTTLLGQFSPVYTSLAGLTSLQNGQRVGFAFSVSNKETSSVRRKDFGIFVVRMLYPHNERIDSGNKC